VTSGPPSDQPGGPHQANGDNEGSFFVYRRDDRAAVAALREEMGEEAFARWQRRRELLVSPRPLTDMERAVLRQAVAPLLADLAASGMSVPDIRDEAHEEREAAACGWIQGPGRTGAGIWVMLDSSPAEQVTELAEQLQNWAADQLHDAGRRPEWPGCPQHPSPAHRLEPQVRDGRAAWVCWESGQVIWPIGELEMPGGARRRGKRGRRP
jgi:hypothetical protein